LTLEADSDELMQTKRKSGVCKIGPGQEGLKNASNIGHVGPKEAGEAIVMTGLQRMSIALSRLSGVLPSCEWKW